MVWSKEQISKHLEASRILSRVKDFSLEFIRKSPETTEYEVQKFIQHLFIKNNLRLAEHSPIIAFGKNTSHVHYFLRKKTSQKLKPNSLILIDLWSRLNQKNSPFADITWMGFYGAKIPDEFQKIFDLVIKSRDACLKYLKLKLRKNKMPTGTELDSIARTIIAKAGYSKNFPHSTGHSLGFISPHGKEAGINFKNSKPIEKNLGYTIEPGVYLKNKFGVRSEIDFYISLSGKLITTTEIQDRITVIKPKNG